MKTLHIADLFCGAGGTSTGAVEAAEALGYQVSLTAVNHWPVAVATHTANHPAARHFCVSIDDLNPSKLYAEGALDLLWASPACTHHSNARGGRPVNDQSRATGWCVVRWAEALRPNVICVENVPEFLNWGGIGHDGRPLASKKGNTFRAWVDALKSLGYRVEHKILCAADYGDPTTRQRLFIQAVRGNRRNIWPDATHARDGSADLFGTRKQWISARSIIDWSLPTQSIYSSPKPLSPNTLGRIMAGIDIFGAGSPFLIELRGTDSTQIKNSSRSLDMPLSTITTSGAHFALIQPFLVSYYGTGQPHSIDEPLDTITCKDRFGLVQPTIRQEGNSSMLDLGFRMLQPHELAAGQGFRKGYKFTGTKSDQVKQIGNAVPRRLSRAVSAAALSQRHDVSWIMDSIGGLN